jgi:hypothetical protein
MVSVHFSIPKNELTPFPLGYSTVGPAGLMDFDFIPVGPLAPLGMLIAEK